MRKVKVAEEVCHRLEKALSCCTLCNNNCGVDRREDEKGICGADGTISLYGIKVHRGEEPPISGKKGSGTVFFAGCALDCVYCQNHKFSRCSDAGSTVSKEHLAEAFLSLQKKGVHNINLVNPTHYLPQIVEALFLALKKGLSLPIVYNTSGYDNPEWVKCLEGLIDIYLPDIRYSEDSFARKYSAARGYVDNSRKLLILMHEQLGELSIRGGLAHRGVLTRLLLLPDDISGTFDALRFIAKNIGKDAFVSIMTQYRPFERALFIPELAKGITEEQYDKVISLLKELNMGNGWVQDNSGDFEKSFFGTELFE